MRNVGDKATEKQLDGWVPKEFSAADSDGGGALSFTDFLGAYAKLKKRLK